MKKYTHNHSGSKSTQRGAFSLIEVLVVVVIGLILLTISIPAYQSLIDSSERSLAVNSLQAAVQAAQDVALDGREGEDGAIVFLVADNGRMSMIPAIKVGSIREPYSGAPTGPLGLQTADFDYIGLDVFVPVKNATAIQLPESWFVRGYAPIGSLIDKIVVNNNVADRTAAIWYNSPIYGGVDINDPIKQRSHWVFPETQLFAKDAQHVGGAVDGQLGNAQGIQRTPRQSFMIQFDSRTGQLVRSSTPAVFVDPRNSRERPFGDQPLINERWTRVDLSDDLSRWSRRMISASDTNLDGAHWAVVDDFTRAFYIGNISHDTILVKPVTRIAIYNELDLARDLGARGVNDITGTLYRDYDQTDSNAEIEFDLALWTSNPPDQDQLRLAVNRWIEGDTAGPLVNNRPWPDGSIEFDTDPSRITEIDAPLSRLYLIQPYSGQLQEVLR